MASCDRTQVSYDRERFEPRLETEWRMNFQKVKTTWCQALRYCDTKFDSIPRIFKGWWTWWRRMHKDSDGNWNVLYVNRNDDGLWLNTNWNDLDDVWNPENEFFFRNWFYFSPAFVAGEFCFMACFNQPPSILPISLSCADANS